jgi:hypothetical protein
MQSTQIIHQFINPRNANCVRLQHIPLAIHDYMERQQFTQEQLDHMYEPNGEFWKCTPLGDDLWLHLYSKLVLQINNDAGGIVFGVYQDRRLVQVTNNINAFVLYCEALKHSQAVVDALSVLRYHVPPFEYQQDADDYMFYHTHRRSRQEDDEEARYLSR